METNTTDTARTMKLVDLLLQSIVDANSPEIKILVGHRFPDDDAWLCLWLAKKFIPKTAKAQIVFLNAGERLPGPTNDASVLHFDTGLGEYDQHGKNLRRTSSASLLAEKIGLLKDNPGIKPLIELATAVDNIEPLPTTSLHFLIEAYPWMFRNGNGSSPTNWAKVQERVFEAFDIIYGQETQRIENRKSLQEFAEKTILPNGLKITSILWHPELREAAFEDGAAVVIWTANRGAKGFYTGIQRNRKYPVSLDRVAVDLRRIEAAAQGIDVKGKNLIYVGKNGPITVWYLHDSLGLILNGSRTYKLMDNEYTRLSPRQIVGIVHGTLKNIPRETVSRWNVK